jgi:hypothetical protein
MNIKNFIPISQLCAVYKVEMSFFTKMNEFGLIEIVTIEQAYFVHKDKTSDIEKMIRMHHELNINLEGIETVFNLLEKIKNLQNELIATKNRLRMYED